MAKKLPFKDFEDKICITLYGGRGSKLLGTSNTKEKAVVLRCDMCDKCSFYQDKTCLRISCGLNNTTCKYGSKETFEGYTPSAGAYCEWHEYFHKDASYGALNYTGEQHFGVVGDYYVFTMRFVGCYPYEEFEKLRADGTLHFPELQEQQASVFTADGIKMVFKTNTGERMFFRKEDVTPELLHKMFSFVPHNVFGVILFDHKKSDVPITLWVIKRLAPELYESLIAVYPQYKKITPDFVGKSVRVNTLRPGAVIYDCHNNAFVLSEDRQMLTCDNYPTLLPFNAKSAVVSIPVTDDMTAKVADNADILEDTIFV